MRVRGRTGKSKLGLCVGRCPVMIVWCLRLSLAVWIIKSRRCANHIRWGVSGISRAGVVRMTWERIG